MREEVSNQSLIHRIKANKEDRIAWELNKLKTPFFTVYKTFTKITSIFSKTLIFLF